MSASWLARKRKQELVDLAEEVKLPDADQYLKDDLVEALNAHLLENQSKYSKRVNLIDYYARTGSPVKRERTSPPETGMIAISKPRRRQTRNYEANDTLEGAQEFTPQKALVTRTPRTVSRVVSQVDIPASPAQLANVADQVTQIAKTRVSEVWKKSYIEETIEHLRENFSSVDAIQLAILLVESIGLQYNTIKWWHVADSPAIPSVYLSSHSISIPDVTILLTQGFWAPAALWSLTSLWIPLVLSYFFNLTLRSNTRHKSSNKTHVTDPLVFHIVKGIFQHWVYPVQEFIKTDNVIQIHRPSWASFSSDTVATVVDNVPGGYYGMQIGALVGVIVSIYDAALKK